MMKWLFIVLFSVWVFAGCATQKSEPLSAISTNPGTNGPPGEGKQIKGTPSVTNYDNVVATRINNTWYRLLMSDHALIDYEGKVVIEFILHSDGTVSDIKVSKNNVTWFARWSARYYGISAIKKSAPFPKWPPDMVKKLGESTQVRFEFIY